MCGTHFFFFFFFLKKGTIPDYGDNVDPDLQALSTLDLSLNQLTGTIPDSVCNFHTVELQKNQFQCPKPSCCEKNGIVCGECQ